MDTEEQGVDAKKTELFGDFCFNVCEIKQSNTTKSHS